MADKALTTCLWFDTEAEQAANFYVAIFPDSRLGQVHRRTEADPGLAGSALLVGFELRGQRFIALNGRPAHAFNDAISVVVPCATQAEVDYYWRNLLAGGGQEMACGWLRDKYGLCWQIVPAVFFDMVSDPDPDKVDRVMQAMSTMTKFDTAALEKAYAGGEPPTFVNEPPTFVNKRSRG